MVIVTSKSAEPDQKKSQEMSMNARGSTRTKFNMMWFGFGLFAVFVWQAHSRLSLADPPISKCPEKQRQTNQAIKQAEAAWASITKVIQTQPQTKKEDPLQYWLDQFDESSSNFSQLIAEKGNEREKLEYLVSRFGKNGPRADLCWLLLEPSITLNSGGHGGLYPVLPSRVRRAREIQRRAREIQLIFAEFHTRQLLSDKKLLARYYHAVVWDGYFVDFFPRFLISTQKEFSEESRETYWWFARIVVLMLHATSRDDLLVKADPEKLDEVFQKWFSWMKEDGGFLRPVGSELRWKVDAGEKARLEYYGPFISEGGKLPPLPKRPKHPFPDWKGPDAIPHMAMREL